jgi:hypothetical protein
VQFVHMYAELWAAIVLGDADGIRQVNSLIFSHHRHLTTTIPMTTAT